MAAPVDQLVLIVLISSLASVTVLGTFVYLSQRGFIRLEKSTTPEEMTRLRILLENERAEKYRLLEDMSNANRKIKRQEDSEASLRSRIEALEEELLSYSRRDDLPTTPLLVICGDEDFCKQDTVQLNRARVWYRILEKATKKDIADELARRRQNNDLYAWVHVAAHGSREGILLADGISSPEWWSEQLEGVSVLFAANCESVDVGDALAGIVDYVIVFYGDRNSEDIARFTYAFWSEQVKSGDVKLAYRKALTEVPTLRPYTDLRKR